MTLKILPFPLSVLGVKYFCDVDYPQTILVIDKNSVTIFFSVATSGVVASICCNYVTREFTYTQMGNVINTKHPDVNKKGVIEITENEEWWEGNVYQGKPFGYGCLFCKDGSKIYEGFMFNNVKQCYGVTYFPQLKVIEYIGCYCNGKKYGFGKLYDRKEKLVCDGNWFNDVLMDTHYLTVTRDDNGFVGFHSFLECVKIGSRCCNDLAIKQLTFCDCMKLRTLNVGDHSLNCITSLKIRNNPRLKTVFVDSCCFSVTNQVSDEQTEVYHGRFEVRDCQSLTTIRVGSRSFIGYDEVILESM